LRQHTLNVSKAASASAGAEDEAEAEAVAATTAKEVWCQAHSAYAQYY